MYNIWYAKPGLGFNPNVAVDALEQTHVRVAEQHRAKDLDEVYRDFQADTWNQERYARWGDKVVTQMGAGHATMSVGDVIEEVETGVYYAVDYFGFKEL